MDLQGPRSDGLGLGRAQGVDTWENLDRGGHPDSTDLIVGGQRPAVRVRGKGVGREISRSK